ncbi:hypothetical protein BGW38_001379 [Lunasporangiospora selenospora]|uniref:Uncharacterized protein n=1 Tax=Lunasporangiospora selenospora TaxID=979761 RepID=A0A9P6KEB4_9FUNG|nr:hypothetical protein BGW38_001379 [Lunasporangiospora selenospora]
MNSDNNSIKSNHSDRYQQIAVAYRGLYHRHQGLQRTCSALEAEAKERDQEILELKSNIATMRVNQN